MAARQLRYDWFESLKEQQRFDFVLTAHHADDNLETFLINLSRGTGLEGLTGIPVINGSIVRPLLQFTRHEILDFATTENLKWHEDSSNKKMIYLRNNLRHSIIPLLKDTNPSFMDSFYKTQKYLNESQSVLEDYILEIENCTRTEDDPIYYQKCIKNMDLFLSGSWEETSVVYLNIEFRKCSNETYIGNTNIQTEDDEKFLDNFLRNISNYHNSEYIGNKEFNQGLDK